MKIKIQKEDFDVGAEIKEIRCNDSSIGAVVSFVGTVRDLKGKPIDKMHLEHYPGMTEKMLEVIVNKAMLKWELGDVTIIHRVGDLDINDQIVLVITTSMHRGNAFNSCEFIMDFLKTKAPFWKKEHTAGSSEWVEQKATDNSKLESWK